jgi:two-component system, response regulator YesN
VFVEKTYFSKLFKESTGRGFLEYLTEYRLAKARTLLKTTPLSITEIGRMVGYPNGKYFYTLFKKHTSLTPGDYRSEG